MCGRHIDYTIALGCLVKEIPNSVKAQRKDHLLLSRNFPSLVLSADTEAQMVDFAYSHRCEPEAWTAH